MLEIYIEALLVDEELADLMWEAWNAGEIDEATVFLMWLIVARSPPDKAHRKAVKPISDIGPGTAPLAGQVLICRGFAKVVIRTLFGR